MAKKAPDPPDMSAYAAGQEEVAKMSTELAREQMAWAREQDTANRAILERVLTGQEAIQNETLGNAREDRARYENIYQPLEDDLVNEFQNYDTPERQAMERGRAVADVTASFDAQRRNALQRLESYGVDPSQTRNAALDIGMRTAQAAAQAGAASGATRNVENTGRALRAEAINIGKGYPSNVAGSYGQSLAAGQGQVGAANQTTGVGAGAMGAATGALGTAAGAYGGAGNTMSQGYQNQLAAYGANSSLTTGILGAAGGLAGMMLADGGKPPRRSALTIDNDSGEMFNSQPGPIDYGKGDGSGIDDQVPILASTGEYIIPADVVRKKGEEFFDRIVAKYHTPAAEQAEDPYVQNVRSGHALNPAPQRRSAMGG